MDRVPEPELMDGREQSEAYAHADFAEVNRGFVEAFAGAFPDFAAGRVADLGCGPADIAIRLARRLPGTAVIAVDGAEAMLAHARRAVRGAGLGDRIELLRAVLPGVPAGPFDAVVSNSLLHHLHRPAVLWQEIAHIARPGAPVFVMDLARPDSPERAREIVATYAGMEREILRRDYLASLCAAFTVEEVRAQLAATGLGQLTVRMASDRHWVASGRR